MPFTSIWSEPSKNWSFDVGSLMILINEDMELQYRLSRRSLLQCISAAPVVGLQNYIRSYDFLFDSGSLVYTTPYGCASAPLPNKRLEHAIRAKKLLEDGNFSVYNIPLARPTTNKYHVLLFIWWAFTWICYVGIVAFIMLAPETTWIGLANITLLTLWSIVIRLVEYVNLEPSKAFKVDRPDGPDAVYMLGRDNSGFILRGSRGDVKTWVTRGLVYKPGSLPRKCQAVTRTMTLVVLLFVFSTLPNGHTMDQLAFIILNAMGQVNVIFGQRLNSLCYISGLELDDAKSCKVRTRTEVWGKLVKEFKDVDAQNGWIEKLDLLPRTEKWAMWKAEFLKDPDQDPKDLYNSLPGR